MNSRHETGSVLLIMILVLVVLSCMSIFAFRRIKSDKNIPTSQGNVVLSEKREISGWPDRPYQIYLPKNHKNLNNLRVILALHGGGSNSAEQEKLACPNGDLGSSKCLTKIATDRNFAVVYPNGTRSLRSKEIRTFNAGGGKQGYRCVSTYACENDIDDISYFKDLISDLSLRYSIDQQAIFVTGISNGAAMAHRLACELSRNVKAIAPVSGGNQYMALATCSPARPISVLEFHGTADKAWPYEGGMAGLVGDKGNMISIPKTVADWAEINGCGEAKSTEEIDYVPSDRASVTKHTYANCKGTSSVIFYVIHGGGHTWPQGNQYLPESKIGPTTQELNANELMVNFFESSQ